MERALRAIEIGFELDRRWLRGEMEHTKKLRDAIGRAERMKLEDVTLRVLAPADLLHAKLRAARDPALKRSKRILDLGDAESPLERDPALAATPSDEARALLARVGV